MGPIPTRNTLAGNPHAAFVGRPCDLSVQSKKGGLRLGALLSFALCLKTGEGLPSIDPIAPGTVNTVQPTLAKLFRRAHCHETVVI